MMAETAAAGNSLTITHDWGFGTATLIDQDGAHTHIGSDTCENADKNFEEFVNELYDILIKNNGLSWVKVSSARGSRDN